MKRCSSGFGTDINVDSFREYTCERGNATVFTSLFKHGDNYSLFIDKSIFEHANALKRLTY